MIKKIKSYLQYIAIIFIALIIIGTSQKDMPLTPDGLAYSLMADNLFTHREEINPVFQQRILPPLLVGIVSKILLIPVHNSFFYCASFFFILLSCSIFYFLQNEIKDFYIPLTLTILLLIAFWPITYNLRNAYQLSDLITYFLSIWMLITFRSKHYFSFMFFGILGTITRQNLWVLSVSGGAYLLLQSLLEKKGAGIRKIQILVFLLMLLSIFILIFIFKESSISIYINNKNYAESINLKLVILGTFKMFSPFLLIFIFRGKNLLKDTVIYIPFMLFFIFSFLIPLDFILKSSGEDFTFVERVGYQGLFPLLALCAMYFGKKLKTALAGKSWLSILLVISYGTSHLAVETSISPFFVLPSQARYFFVPIVIFLIMIYRKENSRIRSYH